MSDGGEEMPPGPRGCECVCFSLGGVCFAFGGVTVPSLKSSDAVDPLCVTGEGSCPCLRLFLWFVGDG